MTTNMVRRMTPPSGIVLLFAALANVAAMGLTAGVWRYSGLGGYSFSIFATAFVKFF